MSNKRMLRKRLATLARLHGYEYINGGSVCYVATRIYGGAGSWFHGKRRHALAWLLNRIRGGEA